MDGLPPPIITWGRPGKATRTVNGERVTSRLYFRPRGFQDFGEYECQGINILGSTTDTITVKEIGMLIF